MLLYVVVVCFMYLYMVYIYGLYIWFICVFTYLHISYLCCHCHIFNIFSFFSVQTHIWSLNAMIKGKWGNFWWSHHVPMQHKTFFCIDLVKLSSSTCMKYRKIFRFSFPTSFSSGSLKLRYKTSHYIAKNRWRANAEIVMIIWCFDAR